MSQKKKAKFPTWKKLLAVAVTTATIGAGTVAVKNLPYYIGEDVLEVVDGDTFFIKANHQPVRLYGVDAPELGYCLGDEARRALSNLILGKKVFLRNPFADGSGRVIALVYADGKLVNEIMVKAGLVDYKNGGAESNAMKEANDYARGNKIGIFSEKCLQTKPPNPSCSIKANYSEETKQKTYYTPLCGYYSLVFVQLYRGDAWFCSEAEAVKAGFTKAESCK
jgi:micrococcal nuclease